MPLLPLTLIEACYLSYLLLVWMLLTLILIYAVSFRQVESLSVTIHEPSTSFGYLGVPNIDVVWAGFGFDGEVKSGRVTACIA